jgi:hypothetical protein
MTPAFANQLHPECVPDLYKDAEYFVQRYHQRESLVRDQEGWNQSVTLIATDQEEGVLISILDGRVIEVRQLSAAMMASPAAGVVVFGARALLSEILRLQRQPSESYLFGELIIQGREPDFLRLDYIVATLGDSGQ